MFSSCVKVLTSHSELLTSHSELLTSHSERRNWSRKRRDGLKRLLKSYLVIPYSPKVCEVWGRIRSDRKSQPISVDDAWIAASAVVYNCPLITHNPRDLSGIAELKLLTEKA